MVASCLRAVPLHFPQLHPPSPPTASCAPHRATAPVGHVVAAWAGRAPHCSLCLHPRCLSCFLSHKALSRTGLFSHCAGAAWLLAMPTVIIGGFDSRPQAPFFGSTSKFLVAADATGVPQAKGCPRAVDQGVPERCSPFGNASSYLLLSVGARVSERSHAFFPPASFLHRTCHLVRRENTQRRYVCVRCVKSESRDLYENRSIF